VMPGGAANLTCVAVGAPMPQVRWRLGAIDLTPEDSVPFGKNILMLTNFRKTATYTCVATSELGTIEKEVEVRVKGYILYSLLIIMCEVIMCVAVLLFF